MYQSLFLLKLQAEACHFIKKETVAQMFRVNFVKFLRTPFLQNISGRLYLGLEFSLYILFLLHITLQFISLIDFSIFSEKCI